VDVVDCALSLDCQRGSIWSFTLAFQVFFSEQGSQGLLGHASKQQLENTFGTSKDTEVVEQILNKGKSQSGDAIMTHTFVKNAAKSSLVIDNKGKGLSGIWLKEPRRTEVLKSPVLL